VSSTLILISSIAAVVVVALSCWALQVRARRRLRAGADDPVFFRRYRGPIV
jgi:hypothetical protein